MHSTVWRPACILVAAGWVLCIEAGASESPSLRVERLQCEGRAGPLGVETPGPHLSWILVSSDRGTSQIAYQVQAATCPSLLSEGSGDLWDSGRISSGRQRARYAGRALRPMERAYWKVRAWGKSGEPSPWSEVSEWTMGLPTAEDWQANWIAGAELPPLLRDAQWIWIAGEDALAAAPGPAYFRRIFRIEDAPALRSAEVCITVDNGFALYVNERKVVMRDRWEIVTKVDVTELLHPGANILAVQAVNGAEHANPAALIARLDIVYADGGSEAVVSDDQWRASREATGGWRGLDFEDTVWAQANGLGPFGIEPWGTKASGPVHALPMFRKVFTLADKRIRRALVFVCGLGHFELVVNDTKVGDHFLDPGWTNYRKTCLYVPFDVTAVMRSGPNALGVMLGNGMYNVAGGRYVKFTGSFGQPKLILQMQIEYEDGSVERVVTDESWRTAASPITFSCIYGGEDYDARMEQRGWCTADFDGSAWSPARIVRGPGGTLRPQTAPPIKVVETLAPASMKRIAPGEYAVDLGYNVSARPVLKVKGPGGSRVTLRVAERPNEPWQGHSYTYTLRGEGDELFRPRFTYFGFQYLYVAGADIESDAEPGSDRPVLKAVGSDFVTSASPATGAFHTDNALLNDIDAMVDRSVRSNLQSVLTDCPHREKLGWLEVAHLMGPSILYHYDAGGLYRKICRDTTESQLDNGLVPDIAPEYTRFTGGYFESAEWGSASVQLPWLLYRWYGDDDILARQYDTMAAYTQYLASTCDDKGLAKAGLGDWYDWTPAKGHGGHSRLTPGELTATAMLFDNARIVGETAALLGRTDDAQAFEELAARVREAFIASYYNADEHSVSTGSQAALAVGLHFGLVPEGERPAVLANLVRALEETGYRQTTGEVCFRFLVQSLARAGRSDVVFRMIDRTDPPGYGCMLRQFGLKTLSERWDRPGSSLNHCMFGHIQEWFQGDVLGIRQTEDSVGFERLRIAPTPVGDLHEARGHFDSQRGRIAVAWRESHQAFVLDVTIPGNTRADIVLPVDLAASVTESGVAVAEAEGVLRFRAVDGRPVVTAGSGTYRFECTQ